LVGEEEPWVILGADVPVYSAANTTAAILTRLSWDLVRVTNPVVASAGTAHQWVQIITPDGKKDFVSGSAIRSNADYHVCFNRSEGRWLITEFWSQ
jgi:hypothetical protein